MARPRKNVVKDQNSLLTPDNVVEIPVEEQPYPLPKGWKWVRLGDLTKIIGGGTPSSKVKEYYDGDIPWLSPADLSDYQEVYISRGKKMITLAGLNNSSARMMPAGTVCLSSRAPIGYVVIAKNPLCTNQGFKSFLPSHLYIPNFLYWYLKGNKHLLESYASGTTFLELSGSKIARIEFPLPTIDEQQRIVDRIESLFAKLDEAREKAEAVLDGFESRKAAILHKAFTGELTAKWRTLKNISLDSWVSCPLISVLKEKPRNGYSPKPVDYKTSIKSMTLSATTSGFFRSEFFKYIDEEIPDDSHLWLSYGDILIQRANSIEKVGTSAIYTGCEHEFIYPDLMMKLRVKSSYSYRYITYILSTHTVLGYFRANATGTAGNMPKINQQTVSNTPIVVPSYNEQNEIVRILDELLEKERQVKEAAEDVLERIDLMKKAILAKAFRGELTR